MDSSDATKPRLFFFSLKEHIQSFVMLIFYLEHKLKDPVQNCSGTFKEREKMERGRNRAWVAPQGSVIKYEGKQNKNAQVTIWAEQGIKAHIFCLSSRRVDWDISPDSPSD